MSEKKKMKTVCAYCEQEFAFDSEGKGVELFVCPFCNGQLKIVFEENSDEVLYRSLKVEK